MPQLTVAEAAATYEGSMRNVAPTGEGVCSICHTFIGENYDVCYACLRQPAQLDAILPITYSDHLGQIHTPRFGTTRTVRSKYNATRCHDLRRSFGCFSSAMRPA